MVWQKITEASLSTTWGHNQIEARVYCPSKAACSGYTVGYNWACPGFSFSQSDKWERGRRCICTAFASDWGWGEKIKSKRLRNLWPAPDDNIMTVPCPATAQHDCGDIGALHSWLEGPHLVILSYLHHTPIHYTPIHHVLWIQWTLAHTWSCYIHSAYMMIAFGLNSKNIWGQAFTLQAEKLRSWHAC